jgi:hypothetical protein
VQSGVVPIAKQWVPGSEHWGWVGQQPWSRLPHAHEPAWQRPVPAQISPSATQRPFQQHADPAQLDPSQQSWPGAPQAWHISGPPLAMQRNPA